MNEITLTIESKLAYLYADRIIGGKTKIEEVPSSLLIATYSALAQLYAQRIVQGKNTFYDVPSSLRVEVAEILISWGRIDLVPEEYRP